MDPFGATIPVFLALPIVVDDPWHELLNRVVLLGVRRNIVICSVVFDRICDICLVKQAQTRVFEKDFANESFVHQGIFSEMNLDVDLLLHHPAVGTRIWLDVSFIIIKDNRTKGITI